MNYVSAFQDKHFDQKISDLQKELRREHDLQSNYEAKLSEGKPQDHKPTSDSSQYEGPSKTRSALAKKYHIKYQDTIDPTEDGVKQLDGMIGLKSVKDLIKHYIASAEIDQRARELGQDNKMASLNMIFMGNPGTGKTEVARIVGKILFQKHIVKKPLFLECSARDLMSTLVGGALLKTHKLMQRARGGVLFIDEVYVLAPTGDQGDAENSTKNDAVSELLRMAENHRHDTVVILAGYQDKMEELINKSNEGLRSRFNHKVLFPDYSNHEMYQIFMYHAKKTHCILGPKEKDFLKSKLSYFIKYSKKHHENSNARLMRNLLHMVISCHEYRIATHAKDIHKLTLGDINTISLDDLDQGFKRTENNE